MADTSREAAPSREILRALRWLTARSPTPLLVTEGPAHLVRHANPAFLDLFADDGAPAPTDRPFAEAFPELPSEAAGALLDLVYATGVPRQTADFARAHPRRGARVLSLSIWPALDDGKGPRHLVVEARDGTEVAREIQRGRELADETRRINERLVVAGVRMQELADEAERARERIAILAEAGRLLGESIDIATMVSSVARLLASRLVEVCAVELLEGPGVEATILAEPTPIAPEAERALARARAALVEREGAIDRAIVATDRDLDLAQELRGLGFTFGLAIPLRSPTRALGALTVLGARGAREPVDITTLVAIAERVALAIERVEHYQKAVNAARAREELLATVSHDLRSPLHTILFSLALAQKSAAARSPQEARHLDRIRRTAEYMEHLLADLVDCAKMEAHRFLVEREACAVAPMVSDVVDMMIPLAANKSIRLETAIDPAAASSIAWMDRDRMTQVLTNLVSNAVKFTPDGGVILVRVERVDDEVRFAVRDSGPGIPRTDLGRVFDRFWQARETAQLGSGLGLFIARGIVLAHGGTIRVDSEPGAGSTFHVTLPLAPGPRGGDAPG
jgi:signal transduction histidine kinase